MIVDYDQIQIVVFTENEEDLKMYFRLFKFLLHDSLTGTTESKEYCRITSDKFCIRFAIKNKNLRGMRAHFVLNLTQDVDFENYVVKPMQNIRSFLDKERWQLLFPKEYPCEWVGDKDE